MAARVFPALYSTAQGGTQNCGSTASPRASTPNSWRNPAGLDGNLLFTAGLLHDLGKVILGGLSRRRWGTCIARLPMPAHWRARLKFLAALIPRLARRCWNAGNCPCKSPAPCGIMTPKPRTALPRWPPHQRGQLAHPQWGYYPKILERPEFTETLEQLHLSENNLERWRERLRDHQGLLSGMSRLPL